MKAIAAPQVYGAAEVFPDLHFARIRRIVVLQQLFGRVNGATAWEINQRPFRPGQSSIRRAALQQDSDWKLALSRRPTLSTLKPPDITFSVRHRWDFIVRLL